MAEEIILEEGNVQVTSARFIVSKQTYALNGITSVSSHAIHPKRTGAIVCLAIGVIFFFIGEYNFNKFVFVSFFLGLGAVLWVLKKSNYKVQLVTSSGHVDALESRDSAFIDRVTAALNDAIVHRG
jgi:hypothetical protein